jgi:hypothetical protein
MTGLLLKDIFYMRQPKKYGLILIPVIFTLFNSQNILMIGVLFGTMGFAFCYTSFYEDGISHWDTYGVTLPVARSQIVTCKYLLLFGGNLIFALWAIIIMFIRGWLSPNDILTVYAFFAANLLLSCTSLTLIFAMGAAHTQSSFWIVYLPAMILYFIWMISRKLSNASAITFPTLFLPVSLIVLVVGISLSFFLSCIIFKNKEL